MAGKMLRRVVPAAVALMAAAWVLAPGTQADQTRLVPLPESDEVPADAPRETAVLAGGCFWGVQGVFQHVQGVVSAVSGYAGGNPATARYETVSTGTTGHAESVRVTFDPRRISYGRILQIFFSVAHDPTELDRQGPDSGTQYRSAVFPTSPAQARVTQAYIGQLNRAHVFQHDVVTHVEEGRTFYPAEAYHQNYLTLHPDSFYIEVNDLPKITALQHLFPELYQGQPMLVAANTTEANP